MKPLRVAILALSLGSGGLLPGRRRHPEARGYGGPDDTTS